MGRYLNSRVPFEAYKEIAGTRFFVDKTLLLEDILSAVQVDGQKYLCITRPRRFGKSVMANMVAAFFGKTTETVDVLGQLQIASLGEYHTHRNQYSVIYIDFSEIPEKCVSYNEYISRILEGLKQDLSEEFSGLAADTRQSVWDMLTDIFQKTGEKFIFVMDEWDAIFHMSSFTAEDQKDYLLFLKALLKDKVYVKFAYMTGVLPIAKYSSGSELNMFVVILVLQRRRLTASLILTLKQRKDRKLRGKNCRCGMTDTIQPQVRDCTTPVLLYVHYLITSWQITGQALDLLMKSFSMSGIILMKYGMIWF